MRTYNTARNAAVGLATKLINLILAFIVRTIFINTLSTEYLGVSSLFSNVLTVLNISELGIGSAIIFALYKPLAGNEKEELKSLMRLYRNAYLVIGCIVFAAGMVISPFLPHLLKGSTDKVNIYIIYFMYLAQSVLSYWLFAYKRSILEADQKNYIIQLLDGLANVIRYSVQITALLLLKRTPELSFYIYMAIGTVYSVASNLMIAKKVDKLYPFLLEKYVRPLDRSERKSIIKNTYALSISRVSATVNGSADSIIISAFISVTMVGLYSNYLILTGAVMGSLVIVFNSFTAGIGNLYVTETKEKNRQIFDCLHFMYSWIYGFCAICFFVLLNPFIASVWLGKDYLLSELTVLAITADTLISGIISAVAKYRDACGLYWQNRYRPLATVIINVALSILFVKELNWGIPGVLFATIISKGTVTVWVDPYVVFMHVFEEKPYRYYLKYCVTIVVVVLTAIPVVYVSRLMPVNSLAAFFLRFAMCMAFPNLTWYLLFRRTEEYRYFEALAKRGIKTVQAKFHNTGSDAR